MFSLNVPHMEAVVINSLTLEQFHSICHWDLVQWRAGNFCVPVTVHLGAILLASGSDEIVFSSNIMTHSPRWTTLHRWDTETPEARGDVTEDGWTRYSYFIWPAWRPA